MMLYKRIPFLVVLTILSFVLAAPVASADTSVLQPINPITVTSPQGGEVWQAGIDRTITWKYVPTIIKGSTVQILLLKDNQVAATIAINAPVGSNGHGSYKYNFLNTPPGNYRIKIIGVSSTGPAAPNAPFAVSNEFTITAKAKITFTAPQAGQVLHSGDNVTITWNYTGDIGSNLFLHLIHLNGDPAGHGLFNVIINPQAPAGSGGHGSYNWVVPDVPTGFTYIVQASSTYACTGSDSAQFTIVNPKQQPTIKVISPNGGEVWYKGKTYNITWTHIADPGQKVIIGLVSSVDPANFRKLGEVPVGANGKGSFTWTIPTDVQSGKTYKIWLANGFYNKNFIDHSDNDFTVTEMLTVKPIDIGVFPKP